MGGVGGRWWRALGGTVSLMPAAGDGAAAVGCGADGGGA